MALVRLVVGFRCAVAVRCRAELPSIQQPHMWQSVSTRDMFHSLCILQEALVLVLRKIW